MKLLVVAAGRVRAGPERDLVNDYVKRATAAGRQVALGPVEEIQVEARRQAGREADTAAVLNALPKDAMRVLLDERGAALTSVQLARKIAAWRDDGRPCAAFAIGGADGFTDEARASADLVASFGAATWPHKLARVMLAEQLYRAITILTGSPYHRE